MVVDPRDILAVPEQVLFAVYAHGELKGAWRMGHAEVERLTAAPAYRAVYAALAGDEDTAAPSGRVGGVVRRAAEVLLSHDWSEHGEALRWCSLVLASLHRGWPALAKEPPEFVDINLRAEDGELRVHLGSRRVTVGAA